MGKTTDKELAAKVTARIQELMDKTGLKLEGLALLCDIGKSAIKSYYAKTIPISLETIAKICTPFSVELFHFLDFSTALPDNLKAQTAFKKFHKKYVNSHPEYFDLSPNLKAPLLYNDNDKARLEYIIHDTNYFYGARLTKEMVEDFKTVYGVEFESGRLSQLLQSHLDVLDKLPAVKKNKDGTPSKKQVFKYVKKKK